MELRRKLISMRIFSYAGYNLFCLGISLFYIVCLFAENFWIAELFTHWSLHVAVISAVVAIVFFFEESYFCAVWVFAVTTALAVPMLTDLAPAKTPKGSAKAELTILQFNILYSNGEFQKAVPWIISQNADIVVLQEVNEARAGEVEELKKHYKWSQVKVSKKRDAFGMAIFSNLPVTKFNYIDIGDGWNHYSLSEIMVNNMKLHLYELHTPPPVSEYFASQRNIALNTVAKAVKADKAAYKLVVGDLNCTIYSPLFKNMLKIAELNHAQQGYKLSGTWSAKFPAVFRIGIDHVLYSRQIGVESREVKPYQGSDHLPVVTKLKLYEVM